MVRWKMQSTQVHFNNIYTSLQNDKHNEDRKQENQRLIGLEINENLRKFVMNVTTKRKLLKKLLSLTSNMKQISAEQDAEILLVGKT